MVFWFLLSLISFFVFVSSVLCDILSVELAPAIPHSTWSKYGTNLKWLGSTVTTSNNAKVVFLFSGIVSVGTPPQNFTMYFDSGSDLSWVRSAKCTLPACAGLPSYVSSLSSTYQLPPNIKQSSVPYIDGTLVSGTVSTDVLSTAGSSVSTQFIEVDNIQSKIPDSDGILGLSVTSSFFRDVLKTKTLTSALFSVYIEEKDTRGSLILGGVDTARYTPPIQWIPATENDGVSPAKLFWKANMVSVSIGNTSFAIPGTGMATVFDTGSSLAIFQTSVTDQLHSVLPYTKVFSETTGQTKYVLSCNSTLPDVSMTFKGESGLPVTMTFSMKEYTYMQSQASGPPLCVSGIVGASSQQVANLKNVQGIMGNVLLRKYYSVFDYGNMAYGFAAAKRTANITPVLGTGGIVSDPAAALLKIPSGSVASKTVKTMTITFMLAFLFWVL
ncbi:hypothetical protein HK098_000766 [Nowakowskiella sp. JEL0407]|nr:hypothetical protein HK098_000766 [Nowakowskiella sp. JEL0407]